MNGSRLFAYLQNAHKKGHDSGERQGYFHHSHFGRIKHAVDENLENLRVAKKDKLDNSYDKSDTKKQKPNPI